MPEPKSAFDEIIPCEFYEPADLLESDRMYTVDEIGRLLQGLDPEAEIDPETAAVLRDWAIPWIVTRADDLVVAEPRDDTDPGRYGLRTE